MRYLVFSLLLLFVFWSCHKPDVITTGCNCNCNITDKKKDTGMVGCWQLLAVNFYSAPGSMNNWQNVSTNNRSIVQLYADSTFHYDSLFKWKDRLYDHFKTENGYTWLYSSNTVPADGYSPVATVLLPSTDTLIITRFAIDTGEMEKFVRYR